MKSLTVALLILALSASTTEARIQEEVILGKPSSIRSTLTGPETLTLEAGSQIRLEPRPDSPVLEILGDLIELPILDRSGAWVQVQYGSLQGWVSTGTDPPTETAQLANRSLDDERLELALGLLGEDAKSGALGPFLLLTDLRNESVLDQLNAVAKDLQRAYTERFGLAPALQGTETVVLFRRERDYREFVSGENRVARTESRGYTGEDVAALFVGSSDRADVVSVLIHETVHLLNRRVFHATVPPWLEEGMAEDLAYSRVGHRGEIQLGTLAGVARQGLGDRYQTSEPRAHLAALAEATAVASQPDLATLVNLDWEEFVQPDLRAIHYAASAMFLRSLLDGSDSELAGRFLEYLAAVAPAELPASISLWGTLETPPDELDNRLRRFIMVQARAHGLE